MIATENRDRDRYRYRDRETEKMSNREHERQRKKRDKDSQKQRERIDNGKEANDDLLIEKEKKFLARPLYIYFYVDHIYYKVCR